MRQLSSLCTIEQAIDDIRNGRMLIVVDDDDRECSGHLVMAAERVDAEAVNFMSRHACGMISLAMAPSLSERLRLPLMPSRSSRSAAFTVSIDAARGIGTGASA